ncbi:hypothetical protein D1007_46098 [Hordeum vulgare]|nr:hypothetical protein D1007_46098 [Hordeum vulgare]
MKDGYEIHFLPKVKVVTLVLQDFRGRSFTHTVRRTGRMQDLFDFYAAMVPASAVSPGIFMYRGEPVKSQQTPAGLGMEDWDRVYFLPSIPGEVAEEKPENYLALRVVDINRILPDVHLTMRSRDELKVLMDLYEATVLPREPKVRFTFLLNGRRLNGEETPAFLEIEDGDMADCFTYL